MNVITQHCPLRKLTLVAVAMTGVLLQHGKTEDLPPASPIEIADYEEVSGILAWSFRLPEGIGVDEYAKLEWNILSEASPGRIEASGIDFRELQSNDEIKLFLWVEDLFAGKNQGVTSIPYFVKTRGTDGVWKEKKGRLQLPEKYTKLFSHEKSGTSDLNWFLMLMNPKNDKESAYLNLGYAAVEET